MRAYRSRGAHLLNVNPTLQHMMNVLRDHHSPANGVPLRRFNPRIGVGSSPRVAMINALVNSRHADHTYNAADNGSDSDSSTVAEFEGPGSDEYRFCKSSHSDSVLEGLNELRLARQFCDLVLKVENDEFPAHRAVLVAASPYFRAMFTSTLAECQQESVTLNGVDACSVSLLLQYAYTSQVIITQANVQNLLSASNLLQMLCVKDACCKFLEEHMDASNCVGIQCFAETHGCSQLQERAKAFTLENFMAVAEQEEFLALTASRLIDIIRQDPLNTDKEESVFLAVLRWLKHNSSRQETFQEVLEHVRLPLISPYFLHDYVASEECITTSPHCLRLLEEARLYHLLPDRRPELHCARTRLRDNAHLLQVIVAAGGEDDKVVLRSVECYNPVKRQWQVLACLPYALSKHGLAVSGQNVLFLAGGEFPDGNVSNFLWRYDPLCCDAWQQMPPMHVPRSELGLAVVDGCLFAVGGWQGSQRLDSVEKYDPRKNQWEMVAKMKTAVTSPAVAVYEGFLYVMGGAIKEEGDGIDTVQRYDPRANTWTEVAPMLIKRSGAAACVLHGKLFIIGGWHAATENTNKVECYDPVANTWEFRAPMCEKRYRPGVANVDGKIYVMGGQEGWDRYHDSVECYDVTQDTWNVVDEMPSPRSWLACVAFQVKKDVPRDKS